MTGVRPGSKRWRELVKIGIVKDSERNWFLGDAALEIAPMGDDGAHNDSQAALTQYASEIGVATETLRLLRTVAGAWAPGARAPGASWSVHKELMGQPELIRAGMTVDDARRARGSKPTRTGEPSPVEERARKAKEFLADPEVRREVARDRETVHAIERDHAQHLHEVSEAHGIRPMTFGPEDEQTTRIGEFAARMLSAVRALDDARRALADMPIDDRFREAVRGYVASVDKPLNVIRRVGEGDQVDAELAAMMKGE